MSFPSSQTLPRRKRDNPNKLNPMKSILQSMTIWGVLIALLSRFTGIEMSTGESTPLAKAAFEAWPLLTGVGADIIAAIARVRATQFNRQFWQSPIFYTALVGGIMGVLQSMGVDWTGLETLPAKVGGVVVAGGGILGPIMMLIGRARAKAMIGPPGASTTLGVANVGKVPWWALLILKAVPWHELLKYLLGRLNISTDLFHRARQLVLMVDNKPVENPAKALTVYDSLEGDYPLSKPHEREAVVGLAVASLKLEQKIA